MCTVSSPCVDLHSKLCILFLPRVIPAGMVGLAPNWVRLAPNGINPGLFQIRFQYIWLANLTNFKSGTFSDQISVHLAQGSEKAPDLSHLGPI